MNDLKLIGLTLITVPTTIQYVNKFIFPGNIQ